MKLHALASGWPEDLVHVQGPIYVLGVGGPEDAEGIGKIERFVWRFAVLERPEEAPVAFGFTGMPLLMRFTRDVNAVVPFTVPTEVFRVSPADLQRGAPVALAIDPDPAEFQALLAGRALAERRIPELEGRSA